MPKSDYMRDFLLCLKYSNNLLPQVLFHVSFFSIIIICWVSVAEYAALFLFVSPLVLHIRSFVISFALQPLLYYFHSTLKPSPWDTLILRQLLFSLILRQLLFSLHLDFLALNYWMVLFWWSILILFSIVLIVFTFPSRLSLGTFGRYVGGSLGN